MSSEEKQKLIKILQRFTTKKSRPFTDLKVNLELVELPKKDTYHVAARGYVNTFYPNDKKHAPYILNYGVYLDLAYAYRYRNNPSELQQAILHELAHIFGDKKTHGIKFKKLAKQLGVDMNHQRQKWSD